jgi:aarF domain-containing kinase
MAASVATDDAALNRFLLDLVRVGENNGVRFPREFALLLKQILYFDRYTKLLAPSLKVFEDDRINLRETGGGGDWVDLGPSDFRAA